MTALSHAARARGSSWVLPVPVSRRSNRLTLAADLTVSFSASHSCAQERDAGARAFMTNGGGFRGGHGVDVAVGEGEGFIGILAVEAHTGVKRDMGTVSGLEQGTARTGGADGSNRSRPGRSARI